MENSQKREEKKGRKGKENNGPSGGASYRAKGLKPPPQFLLQPLHNFCVK